MDELLHITSLNASPRDPRSVLVKVGKRAVACVSAKHVADLGLTVGLPWTDSLAQRVDEAQAYDKAMADAMRRLNRRALSRRDLDAKLKQREHAPAIREQVLDRLETLSWLDDAAFGRTLIREITNRRPAGPRLLAQKLRQKGLQPSLIDQLLAEQSEQTDEDPVKPACELARKKLRTLNRFDAATRKRRVYSLLARRGFEPDVIDQVMQQLAADWDDST